MEKFSKGKSPFYPDQPVPLELFIGRKKEIKRIQDRSINQVAMGKSQAVFLTGDYGIGKSSLAGYLKEYAEKEKQFIGIHVMLGGARTLEEIAERTLKAILQQQSETNSEKVYKIFSKYIKQVSLFGAVDINLEAIKKDSLNISNGYLPFLKGLIKKFESKGIMLILDEINGIAKNEDFAYFIKTIIDENALTYKIPLFLMLCGVEDRRIEMIKNHQPIDRIFDVIEINKMSDKEVEKFFYKAFTSVNLEINEKAIKNLVSYSSGLPKFMHVLGNETFWIDTDNYIDIKDVMSGMINSAEEIGKKYIDPKTYSVFKSKDYKKIMNKLGNMDIKFKKKEIEKHLSDSEKKKFNNFLQYMKKQGLIKSGEKRGQYIFVNSLTHIYIILQNAFKIGEKH
jgi:hypothetical protein